MPLPLNIDKLHTLILLNMGAILDLPSPAWFGEFSPHLTVHIIDSTRPLNLATIFGGGDIGDRIVLWDDGEVETMDAQRKAWEALEVRPHVTEPAHRLTNSPSMSQNLIRKKTTQTSIQRMKCKTIQR